MSVHIGEAVSMNDPENETITPDSRQSQIQTLNGVVVQDFGYYDDGLKTAWTLQFDSANWDIIMQYFTNRNIVDIDDNWHKFKARIDVKSWSYVKRFRDCITAQIELWRV